MSQDVNKLYKDASAKYYWSLRIGKFVDQSNGQDLREALSVSSFLFNGTMKEWCAFLFELAIKILSSSNNVLENKDKNNEAIYASSAVYKNLSIVERNNNVNIPIYKTDDLPFDTMLVVNNVGESTIVKVLDMNENGSII